MEPILQTKDLSIAFGGQIAVNEVNLSVKKNEFKSIIGPNGAGKTTLFNLLSGELKPTKGSVVYKGTDITKDSATIRTRKGLGRSFQLNNIFPNLTVFENIRLAVQSKAKVRYQMFRHFSKYKDIRDNTEQLLSTVLLDNKKTFLAKQLAHGEQRKLELAMLLALDPDILLLDEPTAGMSIEEVPTILGVINHIKEMNRQTILLIEHKMDMVLDLSDSIAVIHNGKLLADGNPKEIMANQTVQTAYLGGFYHDVS